ncbi:MAG: FAD-dependent oxidoreductase [bacterium]
MNDQDKAIVIGGGIAGVSSALSLADNGYEVYVVEKKSSIGGHALSFCCKATEQCNSCGVCLAKDKVTRAASSPNIHLLTHSEVVGVREVRLKDGGVSFEVDVRKQPRFIDEDKCIACSLCYQSCPKPGIAISRPYLSSIPNVFSIDRNHCLAFQQETGCALCEDNCPAGAIFLNQKEETTILHASALVVATGFTAYDARKKGHLGYGRLPEVITGLDLEQRLLAGRASAFFGPLTREGKEHMPPRIAFIQCVGSRDPHISQDYCSRVCCKYAVRMAAKLKSQISDAEVTIFYIDLQKTESEFLSLVEQVRGKISLIKGLPVEIEKAGNGAGVSMRYENIDKGCMESADFDLVVLSVGISPAVQNQILAETLCLRTGRDGFFAPLNLLDSTVSSRPGIFLAGTCQGPKSLVESVSHGQEAALRAVAFLRGLKKKGLEEVCHG